MAYKSFRKVETLSKTYSRLVLHEDKEGAFPSGMRQIKLKEAKHLWNRVKPLVETLEWAKCGDSGKDRIGGSDKDYKMLANKAFDSKYSVLIEDWKIDIQLATRYGNTLPLGYRLMTIFEAK